MVCSKEKGLSKEEALEAMQEDTEVQFHWSLIAADLEDASSEFLFKEVVKLWLTMRFSLC